MTVDLSSGAVSGGDAQGDTISGFENVLGSAHDDTLTGGDGDNILTGNGGSDTYSGGGGTDTFDFKVASSTSVTITDYTLGATQHANEPIRLCNASGNAPTHTGADSGTDRVITVSKDGSAVGTITLQGITSGSANFANLKVVIVDGTAKGCS